MKEFNFKIKIMTKNEMRKFASKRGCESHYSGKDKRFYFRGFSFVKMDINALINSK